MPWKTSDFLQSTLVPIHAALMLLMTAQMWVPAAFYTPSRMITTETAFVSTADNFTMMQQQWDKKEYARPQQAG